MQVKFSFEFTNWWFWLFNVHGVLINLDQRVVCHLEMVSQPDCSAPHPPLPLTMMSPTAL